MPLDPATVEQIQTTEQADAVLSELSELASAVRESPGGKLLSRQWASDFIDGLDPKTLQRWEAATAGNFGVLCAIVGKILQRTATPADLRAFAYHAAYWSSWKDWFGTGDGAAQVRAIQNQSDEEAGAYLERLGRDRWDKHEASVRAPGGCFPCPIEPSPEHAARTLDTLAPPVE